jgi:peptide-methionine (S)-S-oxide reductase
METQTAVFAAGCFWGVEEAFRRVEGVVDAEVGYTGGHVDNPTYKLVCGGRTGHAEAVRVVFDPERVGFEELVRFFYRIHDPTTLNRQGPDVGTQYRSGIYHADEEQRAAAERVTRELEDAGRFNRPIVTEIASVSTFWPAEEYHQRYFEKNGGGHCHV